ncbi:MAG: HAD family hydrolase [Candidatus Woesearchaeota archaeon]
MYKAILFDIVDTIAYAKKSIDYNKASRIVQAYNYPIYAQALQASLRYVVFVKGHDITSYTQLSKQTLQHLFVPYDKRLIDALAKYLEQSYVLAYTKDYAMIRKKVTVPRGLVTTTPRFMFEHGLKKYLHDFSVIITCKEAKTSKPDPRIYKMALERIGNYKPSQVLYVGDDVDLDIQPAKKLGCTTVYIHKEAKICKHAHINISSLQELLPLLTR